jgi:hypothetical protein
MSNEQIEEIQALLKTNAWAIVEGMLREEIEDVIEGSYSDIAVHILAKHKAKNRINWTINKIKNLQPEQPVQKVSFK